MKKLLATTLILATAAIGVSAFAGSANARDVRDHRLCALDPNCRDHRGPVVVVPPPPPPPGGPIIVVDPIPRPLPPMEPPHRPHHPQFPLPDDSWDNEDYGVSCGEARQIVRENGFRHVKTKQCGGRFYKFEAFSRRDGKATIIINHDGDIVRVNYWAALR